MRIYMLWILKYKLTCVHTTYIALKSIDWRIQSIDLFVTDYPAVVGLDAAGEIVEVGEGVTH